MPQRRCAIFTIVSANYISYAATLMQSVAQFMPHVNRYIVLSDTPQTFRGVNLSATILNCDDLGIEHISNMKAWYTVIEFNTSVKPSSFKYLFEEDLYEEVCYIDPDILLFRALHEVFDALVDYTCVLTPHMMHPLQDGKEPSDLTIMKSGVYNLGFLGLRNDPSALRLLDWWADRLFLDCRVDIADNKFTDQRWMDLAPAFVEKPFILRHPGYNVAYWNLPHRNVTKTLPHYWKVDDQDLVFFHFSGIAPNKPQEFSKHQNRFTSANLGTVNDLCDLYRARVLGNDWLRTSKIPYGFGTFPDGRPIDEIMRHWLIRSVGENLIDRYSPIELTSDFFDQLDEAAQSRGASLTRYMYQLWYERKDLRAAFDIYTSAGLSAYFDWFLGGDGARQGVNASSLEAAAVLHHSPPFRSVAAPRLRSPPWDPLSTSVFVGSSAEVFNALSEEVYLKAPFQGAGIPRQCALLWERRADLRSEFELKDWGDIQSFLSWALSNGVLEGSVDPKCLGPSYLKQLCRASAISSYYGDVPFNEAMILLRGITSHRQHLPGWDRFPVEKVGRLAHGLWFAFVAPKVLNGLKIFMDQY